MKYRGDITPEEYAAMEDGYEQGLAARDRQAKVWCSKHNAPIGLCPTTACQRAGLAVPMPEADVALTDDEWRAFQQIPDQGYSHRAWIDARIAERVAQVRGEGT